MEHLQLLRDWRLQIHLSKYPISHQIPSHSPLQKQGYLKKAAHFFHVRDVGKYSVLGQVYNSISGTIRWGKNINVPYAARFTLTERVFENIFKIMHMKDSIVVDTVGKDSLNTKLYQTTKKNGTDLLWQGIPLSLQKVRKAASANSINASYANYTFIGYLTYRAISSVTPSKKLCLQTSMNLSMKRYPVALIVILTDVVCVQELSANCTTSSNIIYLTRTRRKNLNVNQKLLQDGPKLIMATNLLDRGK